MASPEIAARLEELRAVLRSESISWGELAELQGLASHIDPGDVELLEAAGVPEFPDDEDGAGTTDCPICGATIGPSVSFPWHMLDEDCRALRDPVRHGERVV